MSEFGQGGKEEQDLRLSEEEKKLVAKLLSDPTYFPIEFRTWLKNYIESAGITINASQIRGGGGQAINLPPGVIFPVGGAGAVPPNALPCDGAAVSRSFYDALFGAIGTTWGGGDGSSTFNVPDIRDRALYGAGSAVGIGATDGRALGQRGGASHHHYFGQTVDPGGGHSHGGSVGGVGDHQHPGVGDHLHTSQGSFSYAMSGGATYLPAGGGSTARINVAEIRADTALGGGHQHGGAGGHGHSLSISGVGDHQHWVDGDTTGGFDQDKPSFAGVLYAISTGKPA